MANGLAQTVDRARRHRVVLGTGAFLRWWRDELIAGLPDSLRSRLRAETGQLWVRYEDGQVAIKNRGGEALASLPRDEEPAISAQTVQRLLAGLDDHRPEICFLMDPDRVLSRTLTLPAAAEDNLRQVLAYEMDRYAPFKADQVHFDYEIIERISGGARLRVRLVIARREEVEAIERFCRERGLGLHAIDVAGDDGGPTGINLLPIGLRSKKDRRQLKWNLALAGLFLILLYAVMWQSVAVREAALTEYRGTLDTVREEASEVVALRDQLEQAAEAAQFLGEQKRSRQSVTGLLAELTRRLPTDTWLQRLQMTGETVQISGQTPETARLVALLEESECLKAPNIKGAVTPDPQSGKERFTIEAVLAGEQC